MSNLGNQFESDGIEIYRPSREEQNLGGFTCIDEDDERMIHIADDDTNPETDAQGDFLPYEMDEDAEGEFSNIATELDLGDDEFNASKAIEKKHDNKHDELLKLVSIYRKAVIDVESYAMNHRCSWGEAVKCLGIVDPDDMSLYGIKKRDDDSYELISSEPQPEDLDIKRREDLAEKLIDSGVCAPIEAYRRYGLDFKQTKEVIAKDGMAKIIKELAVKGIPYSEIHQRFGSK